MVLAWFSEESMDLRNDIMVTSWNVEGLCGSLRKRIVRKWVTNLPSEPDFLCLQEIKADGFILDTALKMILQGHRGFVSLLVLGNGGSAILVHPKFGIEDSDEFLKGQVVWVMVT